MGYKFEIEALILSALGEGPLHGYRIAQLIRARSEGALKLGENQIYPVLHRLESEGFVSAEWRPQEGKHARKEYALTESGQANLQRHREAWQAHSNQVARALGLSEALRG